VTHSCVSFPNGRSWNFVPLSKKEKEPGPYRYLLEAELGDNQERQSQKQKNAAVE
jgi:hypothetical protein